jgi:hypothetical protein
MLYRTAWMVEACLREGDDKIGKAHDEYCKRYATRTLPKDSSTFTDILDKNFQDLNELDQVQREAILKGRDNLKKRYNEKFPAPIENV